MSAQALGVPATYKDIFSLLEKGKIISVEMQNKLSSLMYARNLLAHEYQEFTKKDVIEIIKKISTIISFIEVVKKKINSSQK